MDEQITGKGTATEPHPQFLAWMHEFRIGGDDQSPMRRWTAINGISASADENDLEALIRIALASRQGPMRAQHDKIVQAFQNSDSTFSPQLNGRELQVLAASCLVHIAQSENETLASIAALSISTALVGGGRIANLPMDMLRFAKHRLQELSDSSGRRPKVGTPSEGNVTVGFETAAQKVRGQFDANGVAEAFTLASNAVTATLRAIQKENAIRVAAIARVLQQQDEELQILWWLLGGRSQDMDCAFESVSAEIQPLLFAKELADHTRILPGPRSAKALLSRTGLREKRRMAIHAVVNACDTTWLTGLVGQRSFSPVTRPIHHAIQRQLETGAGTAWIDGWAAATGLPKDFSLTPLAIGELFYQERLLNGISE